MGDEKNLSDKKSKICLLVGIAVAIVAVVVLFIAKGIIVLDHSGERMGDGVYWKGTFYVPCGGRYSEGKTIAKTTDGLQINEVEEDETHTFIVLRSFLDQYLLVREDYEIPTFGAITMVSWNGNTIEDERFCAAVSEISKQAVTDFTYETEAIFMLTENQKMRGLYVGYEGCPVATEYVGYMGQVNGNWYITTEISGGQSNDSSKLCKVSCYTIPSMYTEVLEKYFD